MKTDLSQATFIIPIRIESSDRLRNVITITAFLVENFDTNIIVETTKAKGNKCPVCWKISIDPCKRHS